MSNFFEYALNIGALLFNIGILIGLACFIFSTKSVLDFFFSSKDKLRKFWHLGTTSKFQRFGIVILSSGVISFISWMIEDKSFFDWNSFYMPDRNDNWFYHLFVWSLPLGLFLTWLYPLWRPLIEWIKSGK